MTLSLEGSCSIQLSYRCIMVFDHPHETKNHIVHRVITPFKFFYNKKKDFNMDCELPSYNAAKLFLEKGEVSPLALSYIGRSALISSAFLLTNHSLKQSVKNGLIASFAVECYVLYKSSQFIKKCKN